MAKKVEYGPKGSKGFPDFASPLNEQVEGKDPRNPEFRIGSFPEEQPRDPLGIAEHGE